MSYSSVLLFCILFNSLVYAQSNNECITKNQLDSLLSFEANSLSNNISIIASVNSEVAKQSLIPFASKFNNILLPDFKLEIICLTKSLNENEDNTDSEDSKDSNKEIKNTLNISIVSKHNIIQKDFFEKHLEFCLYDYLTSKYSELKSNPYLTGKLFIYYFRLYELTWLSL